MSTMIAQETGMDLDACENQTADFLSESGDQGDTSVARGHCGLAGQPSVSWTPAFYRLRGK
jgi:hypothetical protein